MTDDTADDLAWHALNYRTAATQHAEAMWQELAACVERKIAAERERCAMVCEEMFSSGALDIADRIRGANAQNA